MEGEGVREEDGREKEKGKKGKEEGELAPKFFGG